jgi:hypothetical protein
MPYRYFQNFTGVLEQDGELKRIASTFDSRRVALSSWWNHRSAFLNIGNLSAPSPRDQALVSQGQIRLGMTMDAVWLAWGIPGAKIPGYGEAIHRDVGVSAL